MEKTIGILGGMGPLATVDMMQKIITNVPAATDQDHLHVIADCDPKIPDRTAAILGNGKSPAPRMIASARRLEQAGADFIVIACNTAHYFFEAVQASVRVPILHMQEVAAQFARTSGFVKLGLLATTATVRTGLYQAKFNEYGIDLQTPDANLQEKVMQGITAVKAGNLSLGQQIFYEASQILCADGVEAIIAGCTEIPIVLKSTPDFTVIDASELLAMAAIKFATQEETVFTNELATLQA